MFFIEALPEVIYDLIGNEQVAILDLDDIIELDDHVYGRTCFSNESVTGSEVRFKNN
jgi:hypothetical protein